MAKQPKFKRTENHYTDPDKLPPLKPLPPNDGLPLPPDPYPGSERFGDWDLDTILPVEPGEQLVNDDPQGDPDKFVNQGSKPKK